MKILELNALPNRAHRNQEWDTLPIPDGWAVIPEGMELENFPFGLVTAEEINQSIHDDEEPVFVMTVTGWTPLPFPEATPAPAEKPTQMDILEAQVTYTAMMTNTLLGV